jgi:hypothetical protein
LHSWEKDVPFVTRELGMNAIKSRTIPLSPARKMVIELMHHARKVPALPLARQLDLAEVAAARQALGPAPSWPALFLRAYSRVGQIHPELRRAYIRWPYPHFYEHPYSVGSVLIERDWQGEAVVLGAKIRDPAAMPLDEIERRLRRFRTAPVDEINYFRQYLRTGRMPALLRRFLFWHTINCSGRKRAKRLGTFVLSSLGSLGVEQIHPISPLTTYLTYGPISVTGEVVVKIIYDHRVMDGRCVARCLVDLEKVFQSDILDDLRARRALKCPPALSDSESGMLVGHS